MYRDGGEYYGTHWWWDSYDREYTICAKWRFWNGRGELPDEWELLDWEVESVDPDSGNEAWHYDPKTIEKSILDDGAPMTDIQEVDYI
jgi:hypothetical protein